MKTFLQPLQSLAEMEEIQKQAENQANKSVTKFCTSSYKTLYDPPTKFCTTLPQNNVALPTEFCTTLPQNNVAPPTKFRGTNTDNTEETTEENTHHIVPSGEKDDVMDEIDEIRQFIKSNMEYVYSSFEELKFDLDLKNAIVESSRELYDSDVEFKTFYKSKCNSNRCAN